MLALYIVNGASVVVRADVLYDTTWMADNAEYDDFMTCLIGGAHAFGGITDSQVADDFELADTYVITSVTGDFFTSQPGFVPADGILIEIFEDLGGFPAESPIASVFSTAYDMTPFPDIVWDDWLVGRRFSIDVSEADITLGPGTWWMSIVPVDLSPEGERYLQVRKIGFISGSQAHLRDGGIDHGNGYPGLYGPIDWTLFEKVGGGVFEPGDLGMKIEGMLVELNCPQDLDGNGSVGVKDLLILLGAWGLCPPKGDCPADFDDNGDVGVKDLLFLLGVWGPCP